MKRLLLTLIRIYQTIPRQPSCRFEPSCSRYSYEAIRTYGIITGMFLTSIRILKCHPFSQVGFDPVPNLNVRTGSSTTLSSPSVLSSGLKDSLPKGQK